MDVAPELLPEHPIIALHAADNRPDLGVMAGEVLAYRCRECGAADEDVMEIIHEDGCSLQGQSKPTRYADRPRGPVRALDRDPEVATDGGED